MKPVDVLANVVASPISTNPSLRTTALCPLPLYYADFLVSFSPVSTRILSSQPTVPLTHPLDALYPRGFSPLQPDSSISQSSKGYRFYEPPRCACTLHTATVSGRVAGSTRDFTDDPRSNEERRVPGRRARYYLQSGNIQRRWGKFPLQSYGNARLHLSRI